MALSPHVSSYHGHLVSLTVTHDAPVLHHEQEVRALYPRAHAPLEHAGIKVGLSDDFKALPGTKRVHPNMCSVFESLIHRGFDENFPGATGNYLSGSCSSNHPQALGNLQ